MELEHDTQVTRYCSNCRAELASNATSCPECGVYAGDIFDGRLPRDRRRIRTWVWTAVVLLVVAVAGGWVYVWRQEAALAPPPSSPTATAPVRVVRDRPGVARRGAGAVLNEPEAMLTLRRYLVAQTGVASTCLAILGNGYKDGDYTFTAVNSCESTRLGKWRVDGKTRKVERGRIGPDSSPRHEP